MEERLNEQEESLIEIESLQSEQDDLESSPAEYEILTYPADYPLEVLSLKMEQGEINIPKFQRKFVWSDTQSSKLIESFLMGLPVPPVFLYKERANKKLLVVDGQQRLKSIRYFFEGFFGEETSKGDRKVFRLKGLRDGSKYARKTFQELEPEDQRLLMGAILRVHIIEQQNPTDDTSIYHIFERLNTGGTALNNQEVRNCVYSNPVSDLLQKLNENKYWRKIVGRPEPDARQKDVELVLRFLALHYNFARYAKPMKDFLSSFMNSQRKADEKQIAEIKNLFENVCQLIVEKLGGKPFHIRAGLNSAALDSVMCAFAHNIGKEMPEDIKERYHRLVTNDEFVASTSASTTDEEIVKTRRKVAQEALFGSRDAR